MTLTLAQLVTFGVACFACGFSLATILGVVSLSRR